MRTLLLTLAALGLMAAADPQDRPPAEPVLPHPMLPHEAIDWIAKPTGEDVDVAMKKFLPKFHGVAEVIFECRVSDDGHLINCEALSVPTPDPGIAKAGLWMTTKFRLKAKPGFTGKLTDYYVKLPLRFNATGA